MGIIDDLLKLLSNDGFLIIIEPALQRQTRELMHIHDVILKNKMASVIEPCPHQEKCPMLAHNKRDWCHTYINWSAPKTISDVDDLLGIKHDYLKLSYMILKLDFDASRSALHDRRFFRVVSSPLRSKGKIELLLCSEDGELKRVTRLDKNKSKFNQDFDKVWRGDVVSFSSRHSNIEREEIIKIVERFNR